MGKQVLAQVRGIFTADGDIFGDAVEIPGARRPFALGSWTKPVLTTLTGALTLTITVQTSVDGTNFVDAAPAWAQVHDDEAALQQVISDEPATPPIFARWLRLKANAALITSPDYQEGIEVFGAVHAR